MGNGVIKGFMGLSTVDAKKNLPDLGLPKHRRTSDSALFAAFLFI